MVKKTISLKFWGIILFVLLALLILLPALFEYYSTKNDLMHLWGDQSRLVAETIVRGSENMLRYDEEIFAERRNRLKEDGLTIRQLDSLDYPDKKRLLQFARKRIGGRLIFLDRQGRPIMRHKSRKPHESMPLIQQRFLQLVHSMAPDSNILLIDPAHSPRTVPPGILIRRAQNRGYIYVLYRPSISNKMFRFHRLHRWLAQITRSPNILFIQLERGPRILAQTGTLRLPPLPLEQQNKIEKFSYRITQFNNQKIFDYIQKMPDGLIIRVGISASPLEHLQSGLIRRLLLNSFLLILIGFIVLRFFINKQNFSFLQEKLRKVETSTSAILKNMGEGIIAVNEKGGIELLNPWARDHLQIDTSRSLHLQHLPLPASVKQAVLHFEEFTDVAFAFNNRYLLLSGRAIEFKSTEKEGKHKRFFLIIVRDFTSQKELEEMRNRRSKLLAMGALAGRVAHEIRNPLNGIAMLAQRLQKEFEPLQNQEEYQEMTSAIRLETQRINAIVQSFLQYAKTPEMHFERVPLDTFLQNLYPVLQAAGDNPIHIISKTGTEVRMDQNQMKQVLINLVKNAMEAAPPDTPVTVQSRRTKKGVEIHVEDKGPGIPQEIADRIFDLYFTTKNNGTGLGLSIVEKIVHSHGGRIWMESPYIQNGIECRGTRFIIELNVAGDEENNV